MLLPWPDERCIFCGSTGPLTNGHVIPRAIGGQLAAPFECADCNHSIGASLEAQLARDPAVRHAAEFLIDRLGALGLRLRQRQRYVAYDGRVRIKGVGRGSDIWMLDTPQEDQSLVMKSARATAAIEKMLRRANAGESEIEAALSRVAGAAPGEVVPLGHGITIRHGSAAVFQPDLASERPVAGACLAAMAYRFLAMISGSAILHRDLYDPRDQLRRGEIEDSVTVAAMWTRQRPPEAWHRISVKDTNPVTIDVRLFGQLAWLVTFTTVALPPHYVRAAYRIDLDDATEALSDGVVVAA